MILARKFANGYNRPLWILWLCLVLGPPVLGQQEQKHDFAIALHGGAGTILKKNMTRDREKAFRDKLNEALDKGYRLLEKGGTSMDAVTEVIVLLEDSPLFNAGKGAVFTNKGANELDAAIMDGRNLKAGAVASVTRIKNPILLARMVLEKSPHVMLFGVGAETFGKEHGIRWVDPSYFHTDMRWKALKDVQKNMKKSKDAKHGTVGVVALDKAGNIAAGTSTGGMTNKKYGRVGDSPIIGAGTYADNRTCAVSATGHGEYFIRATVAHDIAALIAYKQYSVQRAADTVIREKLTHMGGTGGVIVLDGKGNIAMSFNTPGMYRGYRVAGGEPVVKIYGD